MRTRLVLAFATVALLAAGCSGLAGTPPPPTPADFAGIVSYLSAEGIAVSGVQTGSAGCDDHDLVGPAISLTASGLDQAQPVAIHLYLFRNAAAYDKLRPAVDACAKSYVSDPSTYESADATPFVAVGQGPWGDGFRQAVQTALAKAAGGR